MLLDSVMIDYSCNYTISRLGWWLQWKQKQNLRMSTLPLCLTVMPTSHPCVTWHSITCHTPSIHQYRVLRGLQLRVQGLHEVYKEGSNGCLGIYWCGWCLTGKDRWFLGSIMWVWWKGFLLDQEAQDVNHHYISHWCLPHILVSPNTPPLVHVGSTAASLLQWGKGIIQVHPAKLTFQGTICER